MITQSPFVFVRTIERFPRFLVVFRHLLDPCWRVSQWVGNIFEILSNLGHIVRLSSGYVQGMFSVCLEYVQGMFRVC